DPTERIIDAAANRAREGLRVLEDIARFALDDPDLTERLKCLRHDLRAAIDALPVRPTDLLTARDTPGDVGTAVKTDAESDRPGLAAVATAAAKRSQEALRTLEESAKSLARTGHAFETARYRLYDLERRLLLRLAPPCPQWTLCVLVTRALCTHHAPTEVIRRAAEGGADCIQIREKDLEAGPLLDHARTMVNACRAAGVHAIINDHADIARLTDADGVHLGQTDLPVAAARRILGPARWIGVSCSTIDHARCAAADHADYCGLGPMFTSTTKSKPTLSGPELIRDYLADPATARLPHLAISGITARNAPLLAAVGARGLAVSSAVCSAEDPAAACQAIINALRKPATIAP
ncbi:MAG: thiamine phosphate synthase, partial [Planctomycetota bacterium]